MWVFHSTLYLQLLLVANLSKGDRESRTNSITLQPI